jgi:hypothetical protein
MYAVIAFVKGSADAAIHFTNGKSDNTAKSVWPDETALRQEVYLAK